MPVGDELYRRHERREIYFTGSCMGGPEPWWCWSCERFADPEPRPPRTLTREGYQLSLLDDMRDTAPGAVLEPPAPYDDPPGRPGGGGRTVAGPARSEDRRSGGDPG
ncbi:hypothetical protein [Actinomadura madurae]|uniref:hypothetical protein n=1 Tax=Actinomadura madurae TaxID=1993 RepID=UPI0020D2088F|nr:hypothetical protein [Actinomadura madurae]MCP9978021.1 hypothetical protein [Actinomadura madurae]MCQ0010477.1 hypothetical protein [Actinomadura madurae]MCQ0014215.1 hypothetical protein [Actinomadura madurae]